MVAARIFLWLFDRPAEALASAREHPRSWWLPAFLVVTTGLALTWVAAPYEAARQAQQTEAMLSRLPAEQRELALAQGTPMESSPAIVLVGAVVGAALAAVGWAVRAGILHLSAVALGGQSEWPGTFATVVWSMLPLAVRNLVQLASVLVHGQPVAHQGLSFLVATGDIFADLASFRYHALAALDPFVLWHLALFVVAVRVALQIRWSTATWVGLTIWIVITGLGILPGLLSARLMLGLVG